MKKLLALLFIIALFMFSTALAGSISYPVDINTAFPDPIFRAYVKDRISDDDELSQAEAEGVTEIYVYSKGISSLKGIEYFANLELLGCLDNHLNTLDLSNNTKLLELICGDNNLSTLDVTKNTKLTVLHCFKNNLNGLNLGNNTDLEILGCSNCNLSTLDVTKNTKLLMLWCHDNQLSTLDITKNTNLLRLYCSDNENLNTLNFGNNTDLEILGCSNCNLSTLDVTKNTKLEQLYCDINNLSALDVTKNTELRNLWCSENNLRTLDVAKNTNLKELGCVKNHLTSLNLENNTNLNVNAFNASNQTRTITITSPLSYSYTVNFADIDANIDPNKIQNLQGAGLDATNRAFTNVIPGTDITYNYIIPRLKNMDVTITVKGAVATATPPPATSTTPPPATSTTPPPTIIPPQTGDESNLALYILLISMSLVVVSAVYIKAKKR